MSKKYFFFMYPSDAEIRSLLNMAVFCLNPEEKWPAHITVAGPFASRPKQRGDFDGAASVFALGVGNFFRQGISTVFLKIGVPNIWKVWNKPDYIGNPVPHLSLYNGRDMELAEQIFLKSSSLNLNFSFRSSGLSLISSPSGQPTFALREQIDTSALPFTKNMTIDQIRTMPIKGRLDIAMQALSLCKTYGDIRPNVLNSLVTKPDDNFDQKNIFSLTPKNR